MASLPRKLLLLNMFAHQASHVASIMAPGEAQARQFHLPFLRTETYSGNGPRNQLPWTRRNIYSKVSTLLQTVFKTAFFINFIYCIYLLPYSKKKKSGAYRDLFLVIAEKAWFFPMWIQLKIKKTDYHAFVISAQKTAKNVPLHFQAVEKHNKVENGSNNFQRNS